MAKPEQFAFPLVIGAAIASVWLALRRTVPAPVVTHDAAVGNFPALMPMPPQYLAPVGGSSGAGDMGYLLTVLSNLFANVPGQPSDGSDVPPDLTYNTGTQYVPAQSAPGYPPASLLPSSGGCSGGCGGCSGCSDPCKQTPCSSNTFTTTGRSRCLSAAPPTGGNYPFDWKYAVSSFYTNQTGDDSGAY
jgi:hypothetical protein